MENQRSIQSANFDLVNTYFGIDVVHTYDGIDVTAYMSYTLSAQKDVHVDSKKDMHDDDTDLFLQIDKRLSEVMGLYLKKKLKPSSKNVFTGPSKAVLPLWIIFGYLYFVF